MNRPHVPLGIIAGQGALPKLAVAAAQAQQRPYFVLCFEGHTDPSFLSLLPSSAYSVVSLSAVGHALSLLREAHVQEIVMAGSIRRPSFQDLKPDWLGVKWMMRLARDGVGDDSILRTITLLLEEEGFHVIAIDDLVEGLRAPSGVMGEVHPQEQDYKDIERGVAVLKALSAVDVGQAVIVQEGMVLGIEAIEGTDQLIKRCAPLKRTARGGVLIKCAKVAQEQRVDLPTIGPDTIREIINSDFAGIAVSARTTLIIDRPHLIDRANHAGIFLIGL